MMMTFKPHPEAENRRQSIAILIKLLRANRGPNIMHKHVLDLFDTLLWQLTEVDGKHKTRYQSSGALKCNDKTLLRHEHVYPRSMMKYALLEAKPEEIDGILRDAVGCVVTIEEHKLLSLFDKQHAGWDRYREARVSVMDTEIGRWKISDDSN